MTAAEKARGASFVLQHLSPKCGVSLQHSAHIANPVYEPRSHLSYPTSARVASLGGRN